MVSGKIGGQASLRREWQVQRVPGMSVRKGLYAKAVRQF